MTRCVNHLLAKLCVSIFFSFSQPVCLSSEPTKIPRNCYTNSFPSMSAAGTSLSKQQVCPKRDTLGATSCPLCVRPLLQPTQLGRKREGMPSLCSTFQVNTGHQAGHAIWGNRAGMPYIAGMLYVCGHISGQMHACFPLVAFHNA